MATRKKEEVRAVDVIILVILLILVVVEVKLCLDIGSILAAVL